MTDETYYYQLWDEESGEYKSYPYEQGVTAEGEEYVVIPKLKGDVIEFTYNDGPEGGGSIKIKPGMIPDPRLLHSVEVLD